MQVDLQIDHCWLLLNRRAPPDTQAFKVFEPTGYNAGRSLHCIEVSSAAGSRSQDRALSAV